MAFRRALGFVALSGSLAILGNGCSSNNDKPDTLPITLFPQAYAQALCGSLRHCCDENQVTFTDPECSAGWKAVVTKLASDPVLAANYDTRIATNCVNQVREAAAVTCAPEPRSISAARDACQQVFVGRKQLGQLCSSSLECAPVPGVIVGCEGLPIPDPNAGLLPLSGSPRLADGPPGVSTLALPTQRKCIALGTPEPGTRCGSPELKMLCEKQANLYCDATDAVCKTRGDVGMPCNAGGCVAGLFCTANVCEPGSDLGGVCVGSSSCNTFLRCDTGPGRCADRLRPAEACSKDDDCSIGLCDLVTKRCLRNAIATSESCRGIDPVVVRQP